MHEHLRLIAVPVADADTLGDVETEVLAELDPPLNLDKVERDPLRAQLSALRKKYGPKRGALLRSISGLSTAIQANFMRVPARTGSRGR